MAVANLAVDRGNNVALRDHNSLSGHRGSLVGGRTRLHDLLEVRRQIDQRTIGCQLRLICIDLELNITYGASLGEARAVGVGLGTRVCRLGRALPLSLHLRLLVQVALHDLLGLRGLLHGVQLEGLLVERIQTRFIRRAVLLDPQI